MYYTVKAYLMLERWSTCSRLELKGQKRQSKPVAARSTTIQPKYYFIVQIVCPLTIS